MLIYDTSVKLTMKEWGKMAPSTWVAHSTTEIIESAYI